MNFSINDKTFEFFPKLESERLLYKQFDELDAEKLFEIRSNKEVMEFMESYPEPNVNSVKNKIIEMNMLPKNPKYNQF